MYEVFYDMKENTFDNIIDPKVFSPYLIITNFGDLF